MSYDYDSKLKVKSMEKFAELWICKKYIKYILLLQNTFELNKLYLRIRKNDKKAYDEESYC